MENKTRNDYFIRLRVNKNIEKCAAKCAHLGVERQLEKGANIPVE